MITAVASTKYKTHSGLPVTLVGLHGKDELLVVGPVWAVLKLANGEIPKQQPMPDGGKEIDKAIKFAIGEMFWLQRLEILLAIAKSPTTSRSSFSDSVSSELIFGELIELQERQEWKEMLDSVARYNSDPALDKKLATEMLEGMFGCDIASCIEHLRARDVGKFSKTMLEECMDKYAEFIKLEEHYDVHPVWWAEWEKEGVDCFITIKPNYVTPAGRNISNYHLNEPTKPDGNKRIRHSMNDRWISLLRRHNLTAPTIDSVERQSVSALEPLG